ncbi:MAG: hypothetical protein ACJ72N_01090 [Labedaea sp.]
MRARQLAMFMLMMVLVTGTTSCGGATTGTSTTDGVVSVSSTVPPLSATAASGPGDACAAFTAQDASAILNQPVGAGVPKSVAADAVSCLYPGKNDIVQTITITLYSGALARSVVPSFASQYPGSVPVPGVGESAVRDATGSVLASVQGGRGCVMHYAGEDPPSAAAFSAKLAAVCARAFASH